MTAKQWTLLGFALFLGIMAWAINPEDALELLRGLTEAVGGAGA